MSRYRIAVVTPDIEQDWASQKLIAAANESAEGVAVDPLSLQIMMDSTAALRAHGQSAKSFDAYILRGFNRQGEIDFQYEMFEILLQQGTIVMNTPGVLSLVESKMQTTYVLQQAGIPVPRTLVTQDLQPAVDAVREYGTAVVKPLYGSFGIGIERLGSESAEEVLAPFLEKHGVIYLQEYVPNPGRDIRAFVVGDEIPAAIYRVAHEGQWKTNVYQGSYCEPCELTPVLRELCLEASRIGGLEYTGVDVMEGPDGPVVLELNGTPSWYGLTEATGRDVAIDVVGHVLRMLRTGKSVRQPGGFWGQIRTPAGRQTPR